MKFEKYETYDKPDLEELELLLEGSFLDGISDGVEIEPGEGEDFE